MSTARQALEQYLKNERQKLAKLEEKLNSVIDNPQTQNSTHQILSEDLNACLSPELICQRWSI